MSWVDVHERKAVLDTVLSRAQCDPTGPLQLSGIADLERLFGSADGVLQALQHRWSTQLAAKLDEAIEHGTDPNHAWHQLAAEQPILRAVLDAGVRRSQALRDAQRTEQPMMDAARAALVAGQRVVSANQRSNRAQHSRGVSTEGNLTASVVPL